MPSVEASPGFVSLSEIEMSNPYEDFEYLADFLPEEGESVIISRRRGQLVCESYLDSMSSYSPQPSVVDRELYGRLVMVNAKLKRLWQNPVIIAVLMFYWLSVTTHRFLGLGWGGWYLDLGLALVVGVTCYQYILHVQKNYFMLTVCPALQKWMVEHQLDKYTLVAWLSAHRNFSALRNALTRWT